MPTPKEKVAKLSDIWLFGEQDCRWRTVGTSSRKSSRFSIVNRYEYNKKGKEWAEFGTALL